MLNIDKKKQENDNNTKSKPTNDDVNNDMDKNWTNCFANIYRFLKDQEEYVLEDRLFLNDCQKDSESLSNLLNELYGV